MAEPALDLNEKPHEEVLTGVHPEEQVAGATGGDALDHNHEQQTKPNEKPHEEVLTGVHPEEQVAGATGGDALDHNDEQQTKPSENESPLVTAAAAVAAVGEGPPGVQRDDLAVQPAPTTGTEARSVINASRRVRTIDPTSGVDLLITPTGLAAESPITVPMMMKDSVSKTPDRAALCYKEDGNWKTITYTEYYRQCVAAAKSFLKLGLEPFHGVGILGFNSPEWLVSDLGAIFAGGIAVGIYTTNSPEACQFVAHDCKANVLVVENKKQLDKILQVRDQLPHLKAIVQYKGKLSQQYPNVLEWDQFMELGKDVDDSVIEEKIKSQRPEQCALLVYTSGTTGDPKGVMLSHDNITWTLKAIKSTFNLGFGEDHGVSYMPLSHTAGQISEVFLPILLGGTLHFAQPDALKGTLLQTIREARPTYFYSVPRVWEKFKEGFEARSQQMSSMKKAVTRWARKKGVKGNTRKQQHRSYPRLWAVAGKLVFKKVHTLMGLDRCKVCICGSAPVSLEVLRFFMSIDIPLLEFYGMSESSGPHTFNVMEHWRVGSVGRNMVGAKTKIDKPDENGDGEILYYGRHIFMGYLNDEEKTKEAIDEEGWLHSGDVGRIDEDGFLYITGRIKELVITSGGKNIAPVPIENEIKENVPFLSNVMVVGDHRKYISCLITLKCVMNLETGEPTDDLLPQAIDMIAALGSQCTKVSEVVQQQDPAVYAAIQKGIDEVNEHAETSVHTVKKFTILESDFSIPGGELGPTLKLKRSVVAKKYAEKINAMYAGDENTTESLRFFNASSSSAT